MVHRYLTTCSSQRMQLYQPTTSTPSEGNADHLDRHPEEGAWILSQLPALRPLWHVGSTRHPLGGAAGVVRRFG